MPLQLDRRSFLASAAAALTTTSAAPADAKRRFTPPRFTYRSGFFTNLHHRLHREAFVRRTTPHGQVIISGAETLDARDHDAWFHAIHAYETSAFARDLTTPALESIALGLCAADDARSLAAVRSLPPSLVQTLERAAPAYRRAFWRDDNAKNTAWIATVTPLVAQYGATVAQRVSDVFETPYPSAPMPVDVVRYADVFGAYTTTPLEHAFIASGSPLNAGRAALEVLSIQAARRLVFPDRGTVARAIGDEAKRERAAPPPDLWRALIYYTVARVVTDVYRKTGQPSYEPYAQVTGLFIQLWPQFRAPLFTHWQAYLDGSEKFGRALAEIVADLTAKRRGEP